MQVQGSTLKIRPKPPQAKKPRPAAYHLPTCPTCQTRGRNLAGAKFWCSRCGKGFVA